MRKLITFIYIATSFWFFHPFQATAQNAPQADEDAAGEIIKYCIDSLTNNTPAPKECDEMYQKMCQALEEAASSQGYSPEQVATIVLERTKKEGAMNRYRLLSVAFQKSCPQYVFSIEN